MHSKVSDCKQLFLTYYLPTGRSISASAIVVGVLAVGRPTVEIIVYPEALFPGQYIPGAILRAFGIFLCKDPIPALGGLGFNPEKRGAGGAVA